MAQSARTNGNTTVTPKEFDTICKKKMVMRLNSMHNGEHLITLTRPIIANDTRLLNVCEEVEPSVKDS